MEILKRTISFLLVCAMLLGLVPAASAATVVPSGDCGAEGGNVTWTLYDDGELVISGSGAMADYISDASVSYGSSAPWFENRQQITSITIDDGVTHVGDYAFYLCSEAASVKIAGSVKTIGRFAFGGNPWEDPMKLNQVSLSEGLEAIFLGAFTNCENLTSITIPDSVKTIDAQVFYQCYGLKEVKLGKGLTEICDLAFMYCSGLKEVIIPDSVTYVGEWAFYGCSSVTKLVIGKGVETLGKQVFCEMTSLTAVTIPGNIKELPHGAFYQCSNLKEVTFSEGLQTIGESAFYRCYALESVVLPSTLTRLEARVFMYCSRLAFATFQGKAPSVNTEYLFYNCASDFKIYYPSNASGWSTPEWNGYPAYPYEPKGPLPETWPVNNGAHVITVASTEVGSDGKLMPISDAYVEILTNSGTIQSGRTDANGQFAYYGSDGVELRIQAEGYQLRRAAYYLLPGESRMFLLDKIPADGAPYFSMLCGKIFTSKGFDYRDLHTEAVHYTEGGGNAMGLMCEIVAGDNVEIKSVYLLQCPEGMEDPGYSMDINGHYIRSNGDFSDEPFTRCTPWNFAPGQFRNQRRIYAAISYYLDGNRDQPLTTEPIPLTLFIDPKPETAPPTESSDIDLTDGTTASGKVSWLQDVLLDSRHSLFSDFLQADPSIESDLLGFSYDVETDPDTGNRKLRIALGLTKGTTEYGNIFSDKATDTEVEPPFQLLKDWVSSKQVKKGKPLDFLNSKVGKLVKDEFKKTAVNSISKIEGEIIGFYEAELDASGAIVPKSSDGKMLVSITGNVTTGKTILINGFPVYFEHVAEASVATTMLPSLHFTPGSIQPRLSVEVEELEITIPKLSLEGGVGVRGVATVGIGGVFENVMTTTMSAAETTTSVVGSTNAYFRVYVAFLLDYKENFGNKNGGKVILYSYPESGRSGSNQAPTGQQLIQQAMAQPELTLSERNYLEKQSRWNGRPVNLMQDKPLATLQNGVMPNAMPKLHTVGDRQMLLFLADDGGSELGSHTRLMYSVLENGAWSEPRCVWDTGTADLYFDSTVADGQLFVTWQKSRGAVTGADGQQMLASLASQSEIALAVWDDTQSAFVRQQYLTQNETLDMMASVCAAADGAHVTWVSNDENNMLATGGEYTIHSLCVRDGTPGTVEELYTTDRFPTELTTTADADGVHVLLGILNENNRTDLVHLHPNGVHTPMEDGTYAGLSAENGCFLWQSDGVLYRYSPTLRQYEEMISPAEGGVSSSWRHVTNGEAEAIVWHEGQEPTRIMSSIYADGAWQEPIVLADNIEKTITFLDAAMTAEGSFVLVANTADLTDGDDALTSLDTVVITPRRDLVLTDALAVRATPDTATQELSVTVENRGLLTADQLHLTVSDGNRLLLDKFIPVALAPGASCVLTEQMDISQIPGLTDVTVLVEAESDANPADNAQTLSIGHTDTSLSLDVHDLGDTLVFLLTASNDSLVCANGGIRVFQNSLEGTELAFGELGTLTRGENIQYVYTLDKTAVDFGDADTVYYLFSLETDEPDWDTADNVCAYGVQKPLAEDDPTAVEGEEIPFIQPEAVEIVPGSLTFQAPDSQPVKLDVEITPADASITEVVWSSSDSTVVCVLPDGTVIPTGSGTATITASLTDTISDTISVTVGEAAPVHQHTPVLDIGYPATCTQEGRTDGTHCRECGEILIAQTPIPTTAHSHEASVIEPTCTEGGYTTHTCVRCGDSYEDSHTDPLGHDWNGLVCRRCGETRENPFVDVPEGSFYYDPVIWAVANGITNGTSPTTFGPNDQCMRAHVVTFLWRAAGSPEPSSSHNPFVDVQPTDFYYKAVLWAVEKGVTNGLDATHFGPFAYCNRAQVVTFLHRALGNPEPGSSHNPFTDVPEGSFYHKPVLWAVENGVTNGLSATTFGPESVCNRAQIVTFLYRAFT